MSFLDNLENNLKSLEREAERPNLDEQRRRREDKARALESAHHAEQLKRSPFTMGLLDAASRIGWSRRAKVNILWLGTTLRLDARDRRLELRPSPNGILAVFAEAGQETSTESIDLGGDPEVLANRWLADLAPLPPAPPPPEDS